MYKNIAFAVLALSLVVAMIVDDILSPSAEEISTEATKEKKPASKKPETETDEYADEYGKYGDEDEDYYDDDEEDNDNAIISKRSSQENSNVEIAESDDAEVEIFVDEPRRKSPPTSRERERTGGTELPSGLGSVEGVSGEVQ